MRCSVYIATSLDGFIARPDGGLDWLPQPDEVEPGEDYGYDAFMASVDVLVMGRGTFDFVRTVEPWPYGKPVVVLSSRPLDLPSRLDGKVEAMAGSPQEIVQTLVARGAQQLYIDGGKTIQSFLAAGLIDELTLFRMPVRIGDGITLFGSLPHDIHLRHLGTRTFTTGVVEDRYAVVRAGTA